MLGDRGTEVEMLMRQRDNDLQRSREKLKKQDREAYFSLFGCLTGIALAVNKEIKMPYKDTYFPPLVGRSSRYGLFGFIAGMYTAKGVNIFIDKRNLP